ncbi:hypothetical protein N665_1993s0001 [Sinapis alba]|nr:hypothetical protein N665_1993s0001 [Sinapis alba]
MGHSLTEQCRVEVGPAPPEIPSAPTILKLGSFHRMSRVEPWICQNSMDIPHKQISMFRQFGHMASSSSFISNHDESLCKKLDLEPLLSVECP